MITLGSIARDEAARRYPFLAEHYPGRRTAIRAFTHRAPDFVFWIGPDGRLYDAQDAHRKHPPPGHAHVVDDEPDYGGFLRGRLVTQLGEQLIVVYCRPEALAAPGPKLQQFLAGIAQMPVPVAPAALVVSDNADLYGTLADLVTRADQPA